MAEEAILKVSLKDYKQQIDELRASLLTMDNASQEYQQTAEQVKSMQEKLNEVMNVGKKSVEGVEGSYNALRQQLSELKKEWQTLEIGSDRWKELSTQIDGINDQLKEADASIGIFNRNVGDYANSFEEAGKSLLDNFTQLNPTIGNAANAIKRLIPMIKATTKTATAGLKGIKAALAATGIGALIIALGVVADLVARNWDAISDWITGLGKAKKAHEEFVKSLKDEEEAFNRRQNYMKAAGASDYALMTNEINRAKKAEGEYMMAYAKAVDIYKKKSEERKKALEDWQEAQKRYQNSLLDGMEGINLLIEQTNRAAKESGMNELEKAIYQVNLQFDDAISLATTLRDEGRYTAAEFDQITKDLEAARQTQLNLAKKNSGKSAWEKETEEIKARTKEIEDSYKTEIQKLTDKYNKELKLFKKHKQDTTALEAAYQRDMEALIAEEAAARRDALEGAWGALADPKPFEFYEANIKVAEERLAEFAEFTNREMPPSGIAETIKEVLELKLTAEQLEKAGVKSAEEFALKWYSAYQKVQQARKLEFDNLSGATFLTSALTKSTQELEHEKAKLDENTIEYAQKEIEITKARITGLQEYLANLAKVTIEDKEHYENTKKGAEDLLAVEQRRLKVQEMTLKNRQLQEKIDRADLDAQKAGLDTGGFMNMGSFKDAWDARIEAARTALDAIKQMEFESQTEREQAELEAMERLRTAEREYLNERIANWSELANSIGAIISSIGDWYEQDIENQVKNGKMSEKEAEKQYKRVQNIKVADAVIQTISGALAAFMGYQALGQPWGGILGAAAAAAVTAAGAVEIKKIKSQNPYSSSASESTNYASAVPKLADYSPDTFTNLTSRSDTDYLANSLENTNLYVSVTDINNVQNKVKVRDGNSTF